MAYSRVTVPGGARLHAPLAPNCYSPSVLVRARLARHITRSYTSTTEWQKENPHFDDLELNDEYYDSLGIGPEELAEQLSFSASDTDPEGQDLGVNSPSEEGKPSFLLDQDMDQDTWGPEVSSTASPVTAT